MARIVEHGGVLAFDEELCVEYETDGEDGERWVATVARTDGFNLYGVQWSEDGTKFAALSLEGKDRDYGDVVYGFDFVSRQPLCLDLGHFNATEFVRLGMTLESWNGGVRAQQRPLSLFKCLSLRRLWMGREQPRPVSRRKRDGDNVGGEEIEHFENGSDNVDPVTPAGCGPASGASERSHGFAEEVVNEKTGLHLVFVPGGGDTGNFYIGKYEVTVEEFRRFRAGHLNGVASERQMPSDGSYPAVCVTWIDARAFCEWAGVRLPDSVEWQLACGFLGWDYVGYKDFEGLWEYAWFGEGGSSGCAHPVGMKKRNRLGAHDMVGNVREWCADWYIEGEYRVVRGGSWMSEPILCKSNYVDREDPLSRLPDVGFRVALSVDPGESE